jgi:hypothetical protein
MLASALESIGPSAVTNDSYLTGSAVTGNIVFKGNWLNFYPPKFITARKVLTDFITRQSTTPTPVRIAVVNYDTDNLSYSDLPAVTTGMRTGDGGKFLLPSGMTTAGMIPDCSQTDWKAAATVTEQTNLLAAVRALSFGSNQYPGAIGTPLAETLFNVGQFFGGSNAFYNAKFGSIWTKTGFTAATDATKPICVSCQVSAIVEGNAAKPLSPKMVNIARDADIIKGDKIITSGFGGIYPKGILLGEVTDVVNEEGGLLKYAVLKPAADFDRLEEVAVIVRSREPAPAPPAPAPSPSAPKGAGQ